MKGLFNRILIIDLSTEYVEVRDIPDDFFENCIGGKGLATRLLLQFNPPRIDPFDPENCLIFATGPVTGSNIWGSSRYGVFTKSPQTGFYSESYSGGRVPEAISSTGYDAILIKGKSSELRVLVITPNQVSFHDAEELRGMDTYRTEDTVVERFAKKQKGWKTGAVVIGPAGENMVSFAVIENDYWRSAGRTGTGAVMGSKGLKSVLFMGNCTRDVHDRVAVRDISRGLSKDARGNPAIQNYRLVGTTGMVRTINQAEAFPTRYWSEGSFENWSEISADALHKRFKVTPHSCLKCLLACGRLSTVKSGRHAGLRIEGPEYETIFAFGGLCCIDSIEEIAYLNDICDRLGLDTISAGNLCAFTIEAARRKRIDYEIDYGKVDAIAGLLHKIALRQGIGDILARGIRSAAKEWALEDLAIHVKGLEPAGYDPRVLKGMGLGYATSDRGACHLRTTFYKAELSGLADPSEVKGKAELLIDFEDRLTLFDSLILCRFYRDLYPWNLLGEIINALTGLPEDREFLSGVASSISDDVRRFNIREELTRKDDSLPSRFHREPIGSGHVITENELEFMIDDYYRLRGWDKEGRPA